MNRAHPDGEFAKLVQSLTRNPKVTQPVGKKGFGSSGLYRGGKFFAFLSHKKRLVVKLPAERVDELVANGEGIRWNPSGRRALREWLVLKSVSRANWLHLAEEASDFVASSKAREPTR